MTRNKGRGPSKTPPPPKATDRSAEPRSGRFIGRRLLAMWIDATPLSVLIDQTGLGTPTSRWLVSLIAIWALDLTGVALFGATPGKAIVGLRVRSINTSPIGWRRSAIRASVKDAPAILGLGIPAVVSTAGFLQTQPAVAVLSLSMLGVWLYVFAPILESDEGRGRHDRWAATIVIAVRGANRSEWSRNAMQGLVPKSLSSAK